LLSALGALHAVEKVHRDIKPGNVLVTNTARVVVVDFGLVADAYDGTDSEAIGTPAYMAPEQVIRADVGPAADLYSVGVMLYQALTQRLPFEGERRQVLADKCEKVALPPSTWCRAVPPDLERLCIQLLQREPERRPSVGAALASFDHGMAYAVRSADDAAPEFQQGLSTPAERPFVGRHAERMQLAAAFERSRQGRLAGVLIHGESGIGKTALVRQFISDLGAASGDVFVLEGRCHERETIPYKALDGIVDALIQRLSAMGAAEVADLLPGSWSTLPQLFPALMRLPGVARPVPARSEPPRTELRQRGFTELRQLLFRVAGSRPTILWIDDLQWADDDGMLALEEVLRGDDAPPLLFIGSLRESEGMARQVIQRIHTVVTAPASVPLGGLPVDDARQIAEALLCGSQRANIDALRIATEAAGHPFFVEELARHTALDPFGSADLRLEDAIWSRVARLDASARQVSELVVASGKPLLLSVVASAAQMPRAELERAVARLRAAHVLRHSTERGDMVEPYHDRVHVAIRERWEPVRFRALHHALATAFEALPEPDVEALAMHWRDAGESVRASHYAALAGEQAARALAFDRAAAWFIEALGLLPQGHASRRQLSSMAGEALAWAGRGAQSAVYFEAAAQVSPPLDALELRRRAAEQLLRSGRFDEGIRASRPVLAALGLELPASRLQTLLWLAWYSARVSWRGLALAPGKRASQSPVDSVRLDACLSIAIPLALVDPVVAFVFQKRALLLSLAVGDIDRIIRAMATDAAGSAALGAKAWKRTQRASSRLQALAEQSGTPEARAVSSIATGSVHYLSGRFKTSVEAFSSDPNMLDESSLGLIQERVTARILLIYALAFSGRYAELCRQQERGLRDAMGRGDAYAAVSFRIGCPSLAWLVSDRPDLAEQHLAAALKEWSRAGFHIPHFNAMIGSVWAKLYAGDGEAAYAVASDGMRRTRASLIWRMESQRVRMLYARGCAALALLQSGICRDPRVLREVEGDARAITRERAAWCKPFAAVLRAGAVLTRPLLEQRRGGRTGNGHPPSLSERERKYAIKSLELARDEFQVGDMVSYAAAAAYQLAELRGGDQAARGRNEALAIVAREGVVNPERMLRMLVPRLSLAAAPPCMPLGSPP
jgi:hypothetical protein